jgi:hypothetical protein
MKYSIHFSSLTLFVFSSETLRWGQSCKEDYKKNTFIKFKYNAEGSNEKLNKSHAPVFLILSETSILKE